MKIFFENRCWLAIGLGLGKARVRVRARKIFRRLDDGGVLRIINGFHFGPGTHCLRMRVNFPTFREFHATNG